MPVKLEVFERSDAFSVQDKIDLEKLYADFPKPEALLSVESRLSQPNTYFYAARFNDRILGGAILEAHTSDWAMDFLCVRKVTRRRHVAHDLLREMQKQLAEKNALTLNQTLESPAAHPELMAFLMAEGFSKSGHAFTLALGAIKNNDG